jgi:uncharacterized protein YndB with AHSA1/START domain
VTNYAFVSDWHIDAPIDRVWDAIYDSDAWPRWWRHVKRVELLQPGDANGLGAVRRYAWTTALPYTFAFDTRTTYVDRPRVLEALSSGELEGTGRWELRPEGNTTRVRYNWNVRTTRAWMNLLAPLARPAFNWNHDIVMRHGGQDLAHFLQARLISAS